MADVGVVEPDDNLNVGIEDSMQGVELRSMIAGQLWATAVRSWWLCGSLACQCIDAPPSDESDVIDTPLLPLPPPPTAEIQNTENLQESPYPVYNMSSSNLDDEMPLLVRSD
ncbi:hypothetical protein QJS10_CPB17g00363 [Acorus calamus]|uniref:Uncharacterized protein n=1 Tax=Acorus calamus TaxID=4465 RepID=A0AAV9CT55_ACOCL|nr:hypothetical protein QJS10_CPB17g00363 [Acorus calamus]